MAMKAASVVRVLTVVLAVSPFATAGDGAYAKAIGAVAPLEIPHTSRLAFEARAAKKRGPNIESSQILDLTPGLAPMPFPRNSDMRARLLTPELRRTPVVGWIAANLYRDKRDAGWCLELDPGEGEYVVFYRVNLKR
jgi:hypothetical protein